MSTRSRRHRRRVVQATAITAIAGAFSLPAPRLASAQQQPAAPAAQQPAVAATPPSGVTFYGAPSSPISSGVIIPGGRATIWVSGTVPPAVDASAPPGSRARFGDTRTQATGVLKNIEGQLAKHGLGLRDVVYLRAYLVADPSKDNKIDVAGWNAAYGEAFNTAANPTKTARSTVGVAALVNADWLIEIEAFAVFPAGK